MGKKALDVKVVRIIGGAVLALFLNGCSFAPGMYMDRSDLTYRDSGDSASTYKPVLIPITPALINKQAKARVLQAEKDVKPLTTDANKYDYRVGPGDVLNVTVWDHPELTIPEGEYRPADAAGRLVNADGTIFYPYVGTVHVAGETTQEIRKQLTGILNKYIKNPQIDVRVAAFRSQCVYVTGEVEKPGVLPITDRPMSILEAVNLSGGGTKTADLHDVIVTRKGTVIHADIQSLYTGTSTEDLVLQDGDQVYIPDLYSMRVFVLGEVNKPSIQYMDKGRLTLADALGGADGVDKSSSDPSQIYVIRGDVSEPKIFQLNAQSADALILATAFQLQPRDVVYVSVAGVSRWARFMSQIVPTIQSLWQTDTMIRAQKL